MSSDVRLFLSCVSDEFGIYRDALRHALAGPNIDVKIQEDFKLLGVDTLHLLYRYIAICDVVVHFVGEMTGAQPASNSVGGLLRGQPHLGEKLVSLGLSNQLLAQLSYTQWEAWLAIALDKTLLIVEPAPHLERGPNFTPSEASRASEAEHLARMKAIDFYPGPPFTSADNLVAQIMTSAVIGALVKAASKDIVESKFEMVANKLAEIFGGVQPAEKKDKARAASYEAYHCLRRIEEIFDSLEKKLEMCSWSSTGSEEEEKDRRRAAADVIQSLIPQFNELARCLDALRTQFKVFEGKMEIYNSITEASAVRLYMGMDDDVVRALFNYPNHEIDVKLLTEKMRRASADAREAIASYIRNNYKVGEEEDGT